MVAYGLVMGRRERKRSSGWGRGERKKTCCTSCLSQSPPSGHCGPQQLAIIELVLTVDDTSHFVSYMTELTIFSCFGMKLWAK